jgi:hypothetical protein
MWHFEKIIDRKIGLISQIKKVKEELEEYKKATSVGHTIEEFWDSLNALEQIGIRLEEIYGTTAMIEG